MRLSTVGSLLAGLLWWALPYAPWFVEAPAIAAEAAAVSASDPQPADTAYRWDVPPDQRVWYRNPDGSCVQCSLGMVGINQADSTPGREGPWVAALLLWDSKYGKKIHGGSWPGRVEDYCAKRQIAAFNVTGRDTWEWMRWAARTGRFAAIGAGAEHFQTLCGWDENTNTWWVCNNNSPTVCDRYTWEQFQRLHLASGQWVVILDYPPPPRSPRYVKWW